MFDLVRRAAEAGHADHSISAVTEVLRLPAVPGQWSPPGNSVAASPRRR